MEELKPITETKVETIKGREYDVQVVKIPRYTAEEKALLQAEYEQKLNDYNTLGREVAELEVKLQKL